MNYRILGSHRKHGWENLTIVYQEEFVYKFIELVDGNTYDKVMVIQHDPSLNQDSVFLEKDLERPLTRTRKKK